MLRALTTHRRHWSRSELEVGFHSPGQDRAPFILTLLPSLDVGSSCCSFLGKKAPRIVLALRFRRKTDFSHWLTWEEGQARLCLGARLPTLYSVKV